MQPLWHLQLKVEAVDEGQGTLSDAVNKALQYWVSHVEDTHYLLGSSTLAPNNSILNTLSCCLLMSSLPIKTISSISNNAYGTDCFYGKRRHQKTTT
jgi:hypothetical protein